MYHIIDLHTGAIVGKRKNRKAAWKLADKLDLEYGAIRYNVRWSPE